MSEIVPALVVVFLALAIPQFATATSCGPQQYPDTQGAEVLEVSDGTSIVQPPVARDISAEIADAELAYAKQLVYERAGVDLVAQISEYGASASPAGQWLSILFDWHEDTTTRKARYSAEFERETVGEPWTLSEMGFIGEQARAGQDQPIHFNGYLDRNKLEQVTEYAAGKWTRSTTHRFAIAGVMSNRLPPIFCGADNVQSGTATIYQVSIRDLSPRRLPAQEAGPDSLAIGSISSSDNTYTMRITEGSSGGFLTTQADCVSGANCDPELLARLRANLDQPVDSTEVEKRLRDALAVLPASFRDAQIRNTQTLMLGTTEMFFVAFAETPVSESRKETVSVTCYRPTGAQDGWNCHYSVDSISQRVPEQTREIHLLGSTFTETEVKEIAAELRRQIAIHPGIGPTVGTIELLGINSNGENFHCSFLHGHELWKAMFSYDGDVRLEALELLQGLPEDLEAAGS